MGMSSVANFKMGWNGSITVLIWVTMGRTTSEIKVPKPRLTLLNSMVVGSREPVVNSPPV